MTNKPGLDIIRVSAMLGIIVDHYLQSTGVHILSNTGLWMGGVFLMMFFCLSAYLFGMKWKQSNNIAFDKRSFLRKRCLRIYLPLWLIFPLLILTERLLGNNLNTETVLMNLFGLGWVKPFTFGGHLWYITLMMFLYIAFIVFSYWRFDKFRLWYWSFVYLVLGCMDLFGESLFSTFSRVAPVLALFFTSILFFKGEDMRVH